MYKVIWVDSAYRQLVAIWATAEESERTRIRDIYDEINRLLRDDPESLGESREPDYRIDHISPLGFRFRVDSINKGVLVTKVWRYD